MALSSGDTFVVGDYTYKVQADGTVNVSARDKNKESYGPLSSLVEYDGDTYSVKSMWYAFLDCTSLTTAPEIPSSVEYMANAFEGCTALVVAPEIPSSVIDLSKTFLNCTSLTAAPVIPSSVKYMTNTFEGCTALVVAPEIPSSVEYMTYAFDGCTALTVAPSIPSSVKALNYTFRNCASLTTAPLIHAPLVTSLTSTFEGCTALIVPPVITTAVTSLNSTFAYCTSLTTAPAIPSSITSMSSTFFNCRSLITAPEIPSSVTKFDSAFAGCWLLVEAPVIPSSITDLTFSFADCKSLTTAPTIPSSVTNLSGTFQGCTSLTVAPEIPSSVTILSGTFRDCTSLTTAPAIPSSVTTMGSMFFGCTSLTTAPVIPSSVTNMGDAFYNCWSLIEAPVIPESVLVLMNAFKSCSSLTGDVVIEGTNLDYATELFLWTRKPITLWMPVASDGTYYAETIAADYDNVTVGRYDGKERTFVSGEYEYSGSFKEAEDSGTYGLTCGTLAVKVREDYKRQASYKAIKPTFLGVPVKSMANAFEGCTALVVAPEIPSSVEDLSETFKYCTSLPTAPAIPSSVTNLTGTFYVCTSLATAPEIPSYVTSLFHTFEDCTSLTAAPVIPSRVTTMSSTFKGCTSLTTAPEIPSSVEQMAATFERCTFLVSAPAIPSSVTHMKTVFKDCTSLTAAPTIPSSVESLAGAFMGCTSLVTAPEIPSSVEYMANAFEGCTALVVAPEIPSSVTNFLYAFYGCSSLSGKMTVASSDVSTYANAMTNAGSESGLFIVPDGLTEAGEAAWREIAAQSPNVHYYPDVKVAPAVELTRVVSGGLVDDATGTWCLASVGKAPANSPISLESISIQFAPGAVMALEPDEVAFHDFGDLAAHTGITVTAVDSLGDTTDTVTVDFPASPYTVPVISTDSVATGDEVGINRYDVELSKPDELGAALWAKFAYSIYGTPTNQRPASARVGVFASTWTYSEAEAAWAADNAGYADAASYALGEQAIFSGEVEVPEDAGATGTLQAAFPMAVLDAKQSYVVYIFLADKLSTVYKGEVVPAAYLTLDLYRGGRGIAIGKAAEGEGLDIAMEVLAEMGFRFASDIVVNVGGTSAFDKYAPMAALDTGNPKIEFQNGSASQRGQLVFTDYDSVAYGASLSFVTDQPAAAMRTNFFDVVGGDYRGFFNGVGLDKSSNNGVGANAYRGMEFYDKNSQWFGAHKTAVYTDGGVSSYLTSRNMKADGTYVSNILHVGVKKDGSVYYSLTSPAAFRAAIAALAAVNANGYWGVATPAGGVGTNDWIRSTQAGFIPYASGGNSSSLGTSGWPWKNLYVGSINGVAVGSSPKFTDTNTAKGTCTNATYTGTTPAISASSRGSVSTNISGTDPGGITTGVLNSHTNHQTVIGVIGCNGTTVYVANFTATDRAAKYATITHTVRRLTVST